MLMTLPWLNAALLTNLLPCSKQSQASHHGLRAITCCSIPQNALRSMEISFARNPPNPPPIVLHDQSLETLSSIKRLGIMIQSDLKWDSHIADIIKRANQKLYMLRLLKKHCLPFHDLLVIYKSYLRPILEYGAPIWNGGLTGKHDESLEKIQKRALRIIQGANFFTNYDEAMHSSQLTTLRQRREDLCVNFIEKTFNKTYQFKDFLQPPTSNGMNLRHTKKVVEIKCRTNRMKNSAIPYLVKLLNKT